jgi:hypothetical protein
VSGNRKGYHETEEVGIDSRFSWEAADSYGMQEVLVERQQVFVGGSRFSWEAIAVRERPQVLVGNSRLLWDPANSEEAASAPLVKTTQFSSDSGTKARH